MRYAILMTVVVLATLLTSVAQTPPTPPTPPTTQPSAEQTMNKLLAQPKNFGQALPPSTQVGPSMDRTTGQAAVAPGAPNLPVVREGTHKIEVAGRLSHSSDGSQAIFTFDSDGAAMKDPPMIILPNLKLQSMEGAVAAKASDVHFRISGTVTEYKGRNYILLDKAVVLADIEKQF